MAVIPTSELFEAFFKEKSADVAKKTRCQFDRPEVYAYEAKIGKQMVDMNADELFNMILSFNNRNKNDNTDYVIPYSSFTHLASGYRAIFNFYIDNYEVIKNPFYDKKMRGMQATLQLAERRTPFTKKTLDKAIENMYNECDANRARYVECIVELFYNGFYLPEEIVELTEDMINFETKEIYLERTTLKLSYKCFDLLVWTHNVPYLPGGKGDLLMASWNNRYFKYPILASKEREFNQRDRVEISRSVTKFIKKFLKPVDSNEINYRNIYMLGFFDRLVERFGEERAKNLIVSVRNSNDANILMQFAKEYGINNQNVTWLKESLRPLV